MTNPLKIFSRWRNARASSHKVLGINERNLHYIYVHNRRRDYQIADNKILTKEILDRIGVPHPATYGVYSHFFELRRLGEDLSAHADFVIKPAQGSGGGGIVVISGRGGGGWRGVSGKTYMIEDISRHISDIIFGIYSFDLHDQAIVEERLVQHPEMTELSPLGLADVRVILCGNEPVMSMMRIPTKASDGKANIHQGAVGVGIDIRTGRTVHAVHSDGVVRAHPDTGVGLIGRTIPHWEDLLEVCRKIAVAVPLKYLGVDISVTDRGVYVLEINVRPGLQIQDANSTGMRELLEQMKAGEKAGRAG